MYYYYIRTQVYIKTFKKLIFVGYCTCTIGSSCRYSLCTVSRLLCSSIITFFFFFNFIIIVFIIQPFNHFPFKLSLYFIKLSLYCSNSYGFYSDAYRTDVIMVILLPRSTRGIGEVFGCDHSYSFSSLVSTRFTRTYTRNRYY